MTLIDGTDTLYIMGLEKEYQQAREWIDQQLRFDGDIDADTFTLSMTFLGSLLSLYELTQDDMYLNKAITLADRYNHTYYLSHSVSFHASVPGCALSAQLVCMIYQHADAPSTHAMAQGIPKPCHSLA